MANKILAILEQREGKLKKASFEAAALASKLASELGAEAEAAVVGSDIENLNEAGKYGISKVTHLKNSELENYSGSGYASALAEFIGSGDYKYFLIPNTAMGKDLAPRIAVKIDSGILMDCTKLEVESGELVATRPVYAGKALLDVKLKTDKQLYTIRPNVFNAEATGDASVEVTVNEVSSPDLKSKVVSYKKSEGKLDVAEAEIIVSGGRGLKAPENFNLVEDLADALGAAVGASRAVVDAGWRPHSEQVGQTGKTVSPTLYVACGISGAIQHLAGMSSSKYIVAINKDKDAPIFNVADYGIAGDVFEILPALTEEIKKVKN